jgi:hypothetical protein
MGYDGDFYEAYERYLQEERVRDKHDVVLDMWHTATWPNSSYVVDLGCGKSNEYFRFGPDVKAYQGFDVEESQHGMVLDYRSPELVEAVRSLDWKPDAFVSLFSIECTATPIENAELYERLFRETPTLKHGLVAGFYYAGRRDENPIKETGDIVSWQTVDRIEDAVSDVYDEIRVVTRVPSAMFGENVVEVWRILTRR